MSKCALLMTETVASHNSKTPASMVSFALCVWADNNGNMSLVLTG